MVARRQVTPSSKLTSTRAILPDADHERPVSKFKPRRSVAGNDNSKALLTACWLQGQAHFKDGHRYTNDVHFMLRFAGDRIVSIKEYLDTEALGRLLQASN